MKKRKKNTKFYQKYHKWIGLSAIFFVLVFAISGILLNHRESISGLGVSRKWLPSEYHFRKWNNGAVKGTIKLSADSIIMYGACGVWLTDSVCSKLASFEKGMLKGIDNRNLRAAVLLPNKNIFGISTHRLYRLLPNTDVWQNISDSIKTEEFFSDLTIKNDTLYVVTRSSIFIAPPPYESFEETKLRRPSDYTEKVSLFKTMWILHSGEIFGLTGKIFVDILGIVVIIISITGLLLTLLRVPIRRKIKKNKNPVSLKRKWKFSLKWHNKIGYTLFFLLLFLVITGTFLRPPLLIPIAKAKVSPIPFSTLDSQNPWHEKLRMLRYDDIHKYWIMYSSSGFYKFKTIHDTPHPVMHKPPVSVMGTTVLDKANEKQWLVGSFSGLYLWSEADTLVFDAFTTQPHIVKKTLGPPVMSNPINGYSKDFAFGLVAFNYNEGAVCLQSNKRFPEMPPTVANTPISLWHLSLELHVGRIYGFLLGSLTGFFIFISGSFFIFVLLSGYIVYKRRHKKR